MSSGILERVHDAHSLANLLKAGLIKPNTPLKVVFRDRIYGYDIQQIKNLNITHITCESAGGGDFKEISSLRVLKLRFQSNSISLPLELEELHVDGGYFSLFDTDLREMKKLKIMEIDRDQDTQHMPPNLTRLFIKPDFLATPRDYQIPSTMTDLTFQGTSSHLPSSLTRLHIPDSSDKISHTFSIREFPLLTDLEIPLLPPREWRYLKTLPLTRLGIETDGVLVTQLMPSLPESLTSLKLDVGAGMIDFEPIHLPHLSTLDVDCTNLRLPRTVTDLSVDCILLKKFPIRVSILVPPELRLESLRISSIRGSLESSFEFEGLTSTTLENLKRCEFNNSPRSSPKLITLPKVTDLRLRTIIGDLNSRYPSVTSLRGVGVVGPVVFPEKLSHLDVEKISAADVPLGLSSLNFEKIEVPEDYVFTSERWRNIVAQKLVFNKLLKASTSEQRQQLEKLVQEAW